MHPPLDKIRNIGIIALISLLCAFPVHASEIFGNISTNPNNVSDTEETTPATNNTTPSQQSSGGVVVAPLPPGVGGDDSLLMPQQLKSLSGTAAAPLAKPVAPIAPAPINNTAKVLGVKLRPNNTLLRGEDKKIYAVQGQIKKYISNLAELQKYRGQKIIEAANTELAYYQTRAHGEGELIREQGGVKIFVIINAKKRHILNLAELRARYAGLEIYNITPKEMALY